MALFNWPDKTSCGDEPPEVCDALPYKESIKALRGSDEDSNCEVDLKAEQHPSIPIILSNTLTEARSGSTANPIPIGLVQEYTGNGPIPGIMFKTEAGNLAVWNPAVTCDDKRVKVQNGDFCLEDDVNKNVFDESCIGNIADADYLVGGKSFIDCNGNLRMKLIFFDKNEFCAYCS